MTSLIENLGLEELVERIAPDVVWRWPEHLTPRGRSGLAAAELAARVDELGPWSVPFQLDHGVVTMDQSLRSAVAWTVVAAVCLVPSLTAIIVFVARGGLAAGDPFDHPVRATLVLCVMAIGLVGMCTALRLVFVASGQDPVE